MSWKLPIAAHTLAGAALISMDSRTFCRVGPWAQAGANAAVKAAAPAAVSVATNNVRRPIVTLISFPHTSR
ncbi:hypothetical protein ACVWWG_007537 [Bradyrhizobium sp. LB7.2]